MQRKCNWYLSKHFLSWGIISFYSEFIFIVPGHFYDPINHFYFWNIKWNFVVLCILILSCLQISIFLMKRQCKKAVLKIYNDNRPIFWNHSRIWKTRLQCSHGYHGVINITQVNKHSLFTWLLFNNKYRRILWRKRRFNSPIIQLFLH